MTIMRKIGAIALLAGMALSAALEHTQADGALAVAVPAEGLRRGFAYGSSVNRPRNEAVERALSTCREEARRQDIDASRCTLVESFTRQCYAVALDGTEYWAGWAIRPDAKSAEQAALAACRKGASGCTTYSVECDK
jgi:Domain of unknown function (DUF4189)